MAEQAKALRVTAREGLFKLGEKNLRMMVKDSRKGTGWLAWKF